MDDAGCGSPPDLSIYYRASDMQSSYSVVVNRCTNLLQSDLDKTKRHSIYS